MYSLDMFCTIVSWTHFFFYFFNFTKCATAYTSSWVSEKKWSLQKENWNFHSFSCDGMYVQGLTLQLHMCYKKCGSRELAINFDHQWFFSIHWHQTAQGYTHFASIEMRMPRLQFNVLSLISVAKHRAFNPLWQVASIIYTLDSVSKQNSAFYTLCNSNLQGSVVSVPTVLQVPSFWVFPSKISTIVFFLQTFSIPYQDVCHSCTVGRLSSNDFFIFLSTSSKSVMNSLISHFSFWTANLAENARVY